MKFNVPIPTSGQQIRIRFNLGHEIKLCNAGNIFILESGGIFHPKINMYTNDKKDDMLLELDKTMDNVFEFASGGNVQEKMRILLHSFTIIKEKS